MRNLPSPFVAGVLVGLAFSYIFTYVLMQAFP